MMRNIRHSPWGLILLIMLGMTAWGLFNALGAYRGAAPTSPSAVRGLIVVGCFAGFLAFWAAALAVRNRREGKK